MDPKDERYWLDRSFPSQRLAVGTRVTGRKQNLARPACRRSTVRINLHLLNASSGLTPATSVVQSITCLRHQ